jgi:type I restriction enzyme R subunit
MTSTNTSEYGYGRFEDLKSTVVRTKAREYFKSVGKAKIKEYRINAKLDRLLRDFITKGELEIWELEVHSIKFFLGLGTIIII